MTRPKILTPGTCQLCRCTDELPCETSAGPCSWVDAERTLCSACVETVMEFMMRQGVVPVPVDTCEVNGDGLIIGQ